MTLPRLDTDAIRETVDIVATIGEDVTLYEHSKGGYWWGPCPFCEDGHDRFKVWPDTRLFNCRICKKKGDVIEYKRLKNGWDFVTAAKSLQGPGVATVDESDESAGELAPRPRSGLQGEERQAYTEQLTRLADRAARHMARAETPEAFAAWQWLKARGIESDSILRFKVGYNDSWREIVPGYKLPPGVTLPRYDASGAAVAVNVYVDKETRGRYGHKRMYAKGSNAKALFNAEGLQAAEVAIVTEGELDAILINSFFPPHALSAAVATGGAQNIPEDLTALEGLDVILALDNDAAGRQGVAMWQERLAHARPAFVPVGKDVTDFWRVEGKAGLAIWLYDIIEEGKA